MKQGILYFFSIIGITAFGFCLLLLLEVLGEVITEKLMIRKIRNKQKRRFDKPPIAECYCADCIYKKENMICGIGNINHFHDAWFCKDAKPTNRLEDEEC